MNADVVLILVILGISGVLLIGVSVLFAWLNSRGVKKRSDVTTRKNQGIQTVQVAYCLSCPCFQDWCKPTCGLDRSFCYGEVYDYIHHAVHPKCPLRQRQHLFHYKPKDTGSETILWDSRKLPKS